MPNTAFSVETNLIDRNDLTIYEKMCSVVLARYAGRAEFSNMLNINVIAIRMGCGVKEAEHALNSLIQKKLVTLEDAGSIEPEMLAVEPLQVNSRVIKSEQTEAHSKTAAKAFETLESFDEGKPEPVEEKPKRTRKSASKKGKTPAVTETQTLVETQALPKTQPLSKTTPTVTDTPTASAPTRPLVPKQVREGVQELIDEVFDIIDENINDREARIILSFANNDIDLVREKYKIAKSSQVNDKIEMLINELQKKGETPQSSRIPDSHGTANPSEPVKVMKNKQIDLDNINRMVAHKQSSYGKQGNKLGK